MSTGTNQEVFELVYKLKGADDLNRARQAVAANEAAAESLARAYLAGKVAEDDFARASAELGAQLRRSKAALDSLEAPAKAAAAAQKQAADEAKRLAREQKEAELAARRQAAEQERLNRALARQEARRVATETRELARQQKAAEIAARQAAEAQELANRSTVRFSSNAKGASGAVFELSRGFQDFAAAGLYGISNNIEGLARAFSDLRGAGLQAIKLAILGPAGIVAGFTALAIYGPQAWAALKGFVGSLRGGPEALEAFSGRMKALADEAERVRKNATEAKSALDDMRPEAAEQAGTRMRRAMAEAAGPEGLGPVQDEMERVAFERAAMSDEVVRGWRQRVADMQAEIAQLENRAAAAQRRTLEGDPRAREAARVEERQLRQQIEGLRKSELAPAIAERDEAEQALRQRVSGQIEQDFADAFAGDRGGAQRVVRRLREVGRGDLADIANRETQQRVQDERRVVQGVQAVQERIEGAGDVARGLFGRFRQRVEGVRRNREQADRQQEEAQREQDQAARERDAADREAAQRARADAQQFGGGFDERIQAAILANEAQQRAGLGVPDEQADLQLTDQLADTMVRNSGGELTPDRALAAAHEIVSGARQGYEQQLTTLLNQQVSERDALLQMGNSALGALQQLGDNFQVNSQSYRQLAVQFQSLQQALWAAQRQRPLPSPRVPRN